MSLPLPMQADTNRRGQPVLLDDWIAIKLRGIEAGFKEHLNCDVLACWKIIRNNPNYSLHKLKRRIREEVVRLCAPWSWEKRMTSIIHPRFGPLPVRPEKRLPRSIGASWQFHKKKATLCSACEHEQLFCFNSWSKTWSQDFLAIIMCSPRDHWNQLMASSQHWESLSLS